MLEVIKKYRLVVIIFGVLLLGLVGLVIFNAVSPLLTPEPPDPEITDASDEVEVLKDNLSDLLASAPFNDYESTSTSPSRFSFPSTELLYKNNLPWWSVGDGPEKNGAVLTAFATMLSISSNRRYTPASVAYVASDESLWNLYDDPPADLYEKLAGFYGLFYRELPVMNANILNYYLDHDCLVIIKARGEEPFLSDKDSYLVVYGGIPASYSYSVSSPTSDDYHDTSLVRSDLFNLLSSSASFYVFSGASTAFDFSRYSTNFNPNADN